MPFGKFQNFVASVCCTIIRNDSPRHTKAVYDVILEEFDNFFHCYFSQSYCFGPFWKVISGGKDKPMSARWQWINQTHYISSPYLKGPWCHSGMQRVRMHVDEVIMYLAHVIMFCKINTVTCHDKPEITHPLDFPLHLWTRLVWSTDARVDFV